MFKLQMRVAYRDVTAGNHVYHSRYLDWLEIARNEAFREMGCPLLALQGRGVMLPVVECSLRHHGFARYDDLVEIQTGVARLGGAQATFDYRVLREGALLAEARTRHAIVNAAEKPIRMPPDLRDALARHLLPGERGIRPHP